MKTHAVAYADTLSKLGRIQEAQGDHLEALDSFERAHRIFVESASFRDGTGGWFLRQYACGEVALGNPGAALAVADLVLDSEERSLSELLAMASESQRLDAVKSLSPNRRFQPWATLGATGPLARAILRTKGVVLDSLIEDRLLDQSNFDNATRELVAQLTSVRERFSGVNAGHGDPTPIEADKRQALKAIAKEGESVDAALAQSLGWFGQARRALSVRVEEVQAVIPADAALLEFISYLELPELQLTGKMAAPAPAKYGVLILSHAAESKWVQLGPVAEIDKRIKLLHHLVRNPANSELLISVLEDLYDQVWLPLQKSLPTGVRNVILSPDGELDFVSFATLLTPEGVFLGEKYEITYVSSGRDLLAENRSALAPNLLVWANPDFGNAENPGESAVNSKAVNRAASMRAFRDVTFSPLPGAEREGEMLRQRAPGLGLSEVVLHLGKEATELELRRIESPYILHLATHGFVLPELPSGDHSTVSGASASSRNPMLRSGLALAGAQRTLEAWARGEAVPPENDGIVTADEIGLLHLQNTWLVVLSACDTGIGGQQSAEGVLGLRRGFIEAGAQNLLMTLWPIDDDRTVGFIGEFYEAALKSGDAPGALARVQGQWLAKLRREIGPGEACRMAGPFIMSFRGKRLLL